MKRFSLMVVMLACSLAAFAQNAKTVFFVRHAEKASEARDALLSDVGQKRASCLAGVLADAGVQNIIATDVKRTQQTAQPLADHLRMQLTILPAGDIGKFVARVEQTPGNTLVVGHSNTLPAIIRQLTGSDVKIGESDYDDLFVVSFDAKAAPPVLLHYCVTSAPPAPAQSMSR